MGISILKKVKELAHCSVIYLKKVLPLATKAIKGAAHIAAPHLKEAATELAGKLVKVLIRKINNKKEFESNPKKTTSNLKLNNVQST